MAHTSLLVANANMNAMRKARACKTSGESCCAHANMNSMKTSGGGKVVAHANVNPMREVSAYESSGERTVIGHYILREARAHQIQLGSSS